MSGEEITFDPSFKAQFFERLGQVQAQLADLEIFRDQKAFIELSKEHARLVDLTTAFREFDQHERDIQEVQQLLVSQGAHSEMYVFLSQELLALEKKREDMRHQLELLLIPPDPLDDLSAIVEIRAGTGGDEAALFVADCARMYQLYADGKKWTIEVLSVMPSSLGGFKEYIFEVSGKSAYRTLRHEAGTHRVQRVPVTEAQGRLHTSAVTIAVLVPDDPSSHFQVNEKDLKIQTCRASGAGGQHVNKTDSAVRITHIPSGIVCYCQEERSQHRNRDKAMRLLKAKLLEKERTEKHAAVAALRASQVGSGDRSERIRTYNFPQNRVTDHRIQLTLYSLDQVMNGALEPICSALVRWHGKNRCSHQISP
ncbi:peptide chain release factor 1 [Candidatus Similichlamydia laticola]|uniref:Peptide chain release factor 1 n=1 Tax=Candidatus Similichlamydia laticola TaxID=2170265 RepID=A0A369KK81_9BACT|nr:peptide chain release factor 1 [Candidatus Similichlamydia laticola]RDB31406.1 Peptide chain release factor 1 [Candidatus Similichlamydia laticola]